MPLQHPAEDQVPHRPVRKPRQLDQHHGPGHLGVAVVGQAGPAVDVHRHVELLAQRPHRLPRRIPQAGQVRSWRQRRQQDPPSGVDVLGRPPHLGQGVVDVVGEDLSDPGSPAWCLRAEVGQPPVVGLDPGPPALVVGLGRRQGQQAALLEEGRHRVREQHLGGNAVGLVLGQAPVRVPAAVGGGCLQVGIRVDVSGRPYIELVVPLRRQIRPVVGDVTAGMGVGADDGVAAVGCELDRHGVPWWSMRCVGAARR